MKLILNKSMIKHVSFVHSKMTQLVYEMGSLYHLALSNNAIILTKLNVDNCHKSYDKSRRNWMLTDVTSHMINLASISKHFILHLYFPSSFNGK